MRARYWGLLLTQPKREHFAMYSLERAALARGASVKTYIPLLQEGKRITPLFPSYMFVQYRREDGWAWSRYVRGVQRVVMNGEKLSVVPNSVIKELKSREVDGAVQVSRPKYETGEQVRVLHGPFINSTAIYEGMSGQDRVFVLLSLLGQDVRTVMHAKQIGPLGGS